ncbi:hypothetical protein [Streptomyces wuyuanensis]|uniref:hypothetical protein n=1 Tax=Streptomyces wuyuanensis TaxID=1196353 RepID=UPI003D75C67E
MTAVLADHPSWRAAYAVPAGILAVVTVPAHAFAPNAPRPQPPADGVQSGRQGWTAANAPTMQ